LGIGDWGVGIGDWGLGPIPNPQSPIPNPQSPIPIFFIFIRISLYQIFNLFILNVIYFSLMKDKYEGADKEIIEKIQKISSPSLKLKLLELNSITNILLYDKEDKFHNEYKSIRGDYEKNSFDIYKKISDIITGKTNPTELLSDNDFQKYSIKKESDNDLSSINNYKEIDDFWLKAIKNCEYFDISETEEKILHFLKDIQIELHENKIDLSIKYFFNNNKYFKNEIITKHYFYNRTNEKLERSEFDDIQWITKMKGNKNSDKSKKRFFDMFDKEKITNELDENEANFMKNDFLPGILGYYLNLVENDSNSEDNKIQTFSIGKVNIKTIK